jgi:1-acyl-sn-glycerol-3-phosphate acyltransferase
MRALIAPALRAAVWVFFRRIAVDGAGRVPAAGPVILVANHTNAMVDPLVIAGPAGRRMTLTAKSTLAGSAFLRRMARRLDVILVHRRQDRDKGADPARNEAALDEIRRRLGGGGCVCIFPEGVSHSEATMRPFRTGAARVAFDFVEKDGNPGGLKIVPVGLHFERKDRYRSSVCVAIGEPLDVAAWREAHPGADVRAFSDHLRDRVRDLTAEFESPARWELLHWLGELLEGGGRPPESLAREEPGAFARRAAIVRRLQAGQRALDARAHDRLRALEVRATAFRERLRALAVAPAEVFLPMTAGRAAFFVVREAEQLAIGLPIAAWGWCNHVLPFRLTRALARRLTREDDQYATHAVAVALPVFAAFYAVQTAAVALLAGPVWGLMYLLSLPPSGAFLVLFADRVGGGRRRAQTFLKFLRRPELRRELTREAEAILGEVAGLNRLLIEGA